MVDKIFVIRLFKWIVLIGVELRMWGIIVSGIIWISSSGVSLSLLIRKNVINWYFNELVGIDYVLFIVCLNKWRIYELIEGKLIKMLSIWRINFFIDDVFIFVRKEFFWKVIFFRRVCWRNGESLFCLRVLSRWLF